MSIQAGEEYRFEQEVWFDSYLYGTTDQYPYGGECQIVRGSDGYFWDGANYVIDETWNDTTVASTGLYHYYEWQVPVSASNGDVYTLRIRVKNDVATESVVNMTVRPAGSSGGGSAVRVFDAVDFVTGFPSTVGV